MTVMELKKLLADKPDDAIVVIHMDSGGASAEELEEDFPDWQEKACILPEPLIHNTMEDSHSTYKE